MNQQPKALELADRLASRQVRNYWSASGDTPKSNGFRPDRECSEAADLLRTQHAELEDLRKEVDHWRSALTAVMLPDFTDWHENNPSEWPEVAALVIQNLRSDRDAGWAEVERLLADAERLDWLDEQNARKNSANGTTYGWSFNENCNRISLEDHAWPPVNVRAAIDAARAPKSHKNNTTPGP